MKSMKEIKHMKSITKCQLKIDRDLRIHAEGIRAFLGDKINNLSEAKEKAEHLVKTSKQRENASRKNLNEIEERIKKLEIFIKTTLFPEQKS